MENKQIFKNTFTGGLNEDIIKNLMPENQFTDAKNLTLVGDGNFLALQNIKGTTQLQQIISQNNTRVLGSFATKYKIGTEEGIECVTLFVYSINSLGTSATFSIYAYRINDYPTLYTLYTESAPIENSVFQIPSIVDGVLYPESGIDILYFTDYLNRPRKLRCVIPSPYTANFLTPIDLDLMGVPGLGLINLSNITSGGSLLTGTYQLAYQLINTEIKKYTGFSLLTNPIHVYTTLNSVVVAGIGLASNKKIVVDIVPTEDELAYYTHFRLAVIENIGTTDQLTNVGLTDIKAISDYIVSDTITGVELLSNAQYRYTTVDDIVIDLAYIDRAKTITIRDNRLLLGNIELKELEYDNGTPYAMGGEIIRQVGDIGEDSATNELFTSSYKGYFRDEVYRFAISYFDDYGRYSNPVVLDTTGFLGNQASGPDFRFPKLSTKDSTTYYSIMDADSRAVNLGLSLSRVRNHPSWAKGFIILRAKRKKGILFQTPIIPMQKVFGVGPVGNYPTIREENTLSNTITDTTATPMGPSKGFVPYNMYFGAPVGASILDSTGGLNETTYDIGEVSAVYYTPTAEYAMIFDQGLMYNNAPQLTGGEYVEHVDAIMCEARPTIFSPSTAANVGRTIDTKTACTFYSAQNNFRYYDYGHSGSKAVLRSTTLPIPIFKNFDNYSENDFLYGSKVLGTDFIKTGNVDFGVTVSNSKSTIIPFSTAYVGGNIGAPPVFSVGTPTYKPVATGNELLTYSFLYDTSGFNSDFSNILEIVNIKNNLDDNRYGDISSYNEYIYTGTKYVFTNAEQALLRTFSTSASLRKDVTVWGGDCIVSAHTFKISDSVVTYTNDKFNHPNILEVRTSSGVDRWKKIWLNPSASNAFLNIPVAIRASQILVLLLESEYNGSVVDQDSFTSLLFENGYNILGETTEDKTTVAKSYRYNINLNKLNDQKIFTPVDEFIEPVNKLKSRVYYSDLKIYQTDITGFDKIRVGNYLDLEERYGALTKLSVVNDKLVSLQENCISIIPVGERVIETTDLSQLAVRSGEFLAPPVYIDTVYGCQNIASVQNTGNILYFLDKLNRKIFAFDGNSLVPISDRGIVYEVNNNLASTIDPTYFTSYYDSIKSHYVLNNGLVSYVWNQQFNLWEPKMDLNFLSGVRAGDKLLLTYNTGTTGVYLHSMYTGNYSTFFGTYVEPYVKFIANPDGDFAKVYDSLLVNASGQLDSAVVRTFTHSGTQIADTTAFTTQRGEGNWKVKIMRDKNGPTDVNGDYTNRIRGPFAEIELIWPSGISYTTPITVTSALTKYVPSSNLF